MFESIINKGAVESVGGMVILEKDPKVLIANTITEMVCRGYPTPVIMDAVMLSKKIIDEEKEK